MGGGLGMGLGWIFALLLAAGVAALIVVTVRAARGGVGAKTAAAEPRSRGAREILEERYARGEISTEDYRERRARLSEDS